MPKTTQHGEGAAGGLPPLLASPPRGCSLPAPSHLFQDPPLPHSCRHSNFCLATCLLLSQARSRSDVGHLQGRAIGCPMSKKWTYLAPEAVAVPGGKSRAAVPCRNLPDVCKLMGSHSSCGFYAPLLSDRAPVINFIVFTFERGCGQL